MRAGGLRRTGCSVVAPHPARARWRHAGSGIRAARRLNAPQHRPRPNGI